MDKLLYVGKVTSFHGVKGEIKIRSLLKDKKEVFKKSDFLLIDDIEYKIMTYRVHKGYDMVTLEGYTNLNEVMFLKNKKVFKQHDTDLTNTYRIIGYKVVVDKEEIGVISGVVNYGSCDILEVETLEKTYNIPYLIEHVEIDDSNKIVHISKEFII